MADWKGSPDLASQVVALDSLVLLPGNPRQGDVGAVALSLGRFGQMKPIVVDDDGVILAGNHTYLAAKSIGWEEIAVTVAEALEGDDKSAYALADNRLSDLAAYDDELLLDALSSLDDLSGTGYEFDDLEEIRLRLEEPLSFEEFAETDARLDIVKGTGRVVCPECGAEFQWKDRGKPASG